MLMRQVCFSQLGRLSPSLRLFPVLKRSDRVIFDASYLSADIVSRPDVLCGGGEINVWSLSHTFCEPCRNVGRANQNASRNL